MAYMDRIFPKWSMPILESVASIGLLFFLFLVGLELDLSSIRRSGKRAFGIAVAGITLPFIAGVGSMNYGKFLAYNVLGGIAWVVICTQAGWWLAGNAFVEEHFEIVVLVIVGISLLPALIEFLIHRCGRKPSVVVSESTIN